MKLRVARWLVIGYLIGRVLIEILMLVMSLVLDAERVAGQVFVGLIGAVIVAGVFVPYFIVSQRVKNTFVR